MALAEKRTFSLPPEQARYIDALGQPRQLRVRQRGCASRAACSAGARCRGRALAARGRGPRLRRHAGRPLACDPGGPGPTKRAGPPRTAAESQAWRIRSSSHRRPRLIISSSATPSPETALPHQTLMLALRWGERALRLDSCDRVAVLAKVSWPIRARSRLAVIQRCPLDS